MKKATMTDETKNKIMDTILQFDVESLCYKIKHNKKIAEFSDAVVDLLDELTEMKVNMDDKDLVKETYDVIQQSFIILYDEVEAPCSKQI